MKNQLLVCCLLFLFASISCSKTEVAMESTIYSFMSEPEVTRFNLSDLDSLVVKGFSKCSTSKEHRGQLPDSVAKKSGYNKSYVYYIFEASIRFKKDKAEYILIKEIDDSVLGYISAEMQTIGCTYYGVTTEKELEQPLYTVCTYLVYISEDAEGNKLDIWYPCPPADLELHCYTVKEEDA